MKRQLAVAFATLLAAGAAGVSTLAPATAQSETSSTQAAECKPSKYGADDEVGAANLVTPERILAAKELVKQGKAHPLGIVVEPGMPAFPPRTTSIQIVTPGQAQGQDTAATFGWPISYNDDLAQLWFGTGPQLDGLGHLGEANTYYNCNKAADFVRITGLEKLGTHLVPPLVARAVVIDMAKHKGKESLDGGEAITSDDLKAAMEAQGVSVSEGDIVLIHTGWTDAKLKSAPQEWVSTEPGITNEAAVYLASLNPIAVGADTWGVEAVPPAPGDRVFYGHVTFLKENGIYILETMNTGPLVQEGVNEFMFVLGQPRIKGTVQAIINPIALY